MDQENKEISPDIVEYTEYLPKPEKPIMLSAIQPTSIPTLGNYLGAVRNWVNLYQEYDCYFFIVDMHSITVPQDPETLRKTTLQMLAFNIAAGLDPEKAVLFAQSHVPCHAELAWVLNCFSYMGELGRMTQYKDKSAKQGANIPAGLFNYPVLMAADILLYDTDLVPVGADQKQHLELARNLAIRINNRFKKEIFRVPEPYIPKIGAKVMDLQEPTKKMSKSAENQKGVIYLNETNKQIGKKIKSAVTDSGDKINYSDDQPGIKSLLDIQSCFIGKAPQEIADTYEGKLYGHLKVDTANIVTEHIGPIRDKAMELCEKQTSYLYDVLDAGAKKATEHAQKTLNRVYDEVGFIPPSFRR